MTPTARQHDAFPSTARTWIGQRLDEGEDGRREAVRHVMEVYDEPLRVYFAGCSLRWIGDRHDLVAGFFADRLARAEFMDRWRQSGRPLRFWLIVGFKHYLYETARRERRTKAAPLPPEADASNAGADRLFDRACARALVRRAFESARAACESDGLADHWDLFVLHHVQDRSYAQIAESRGIDAERAAVMVRTAGRRFRKALRELVAWDGATATDIDHELRTLMETQEP